MYSGPERTEERAMTDQPLKRILITGSRTWTDAETIRAAIRQAALRCPDAVVVHGAAHGADRLAGAAARALGLQEEQHPARWDEHGKAAGFIRNREMVQLGADVCLAFIKDGSRGATHCAALAEKTGIPVRRFEPRQEIR
jgi:YspA, cpYpsA-related SLOG family